MYQLDAGRLNKRVSIYEYTTTTDAIAQSITALTLKCSVWAEIHPLRAYERVEANQNAAAETYRVIIRYRSDITEHNVLVRGSRQFEITGITDIDEAHIALELSCIEKKERVILVGS